MYLCTSVLIRPTNRVVSFGERFLILGRVLFRKTAEKCLRSLNIGLVSNAYVMLCLNCRYLSNGKY